MTVIYEDEHVQAVWHAANSDFLLITFDHREARPDGKHFLLDAVAKWKSVNTIGFLVKAANWYPSAALHKAADATLQIRERFRDVVTFGWSMGGYAAVKYSKTFSAGTVIAANPAWSADLERWNDASLDTPAMDSQRPDLSDDTGLTTSDISIKTNDVSGEVFVLTDPFDTQEVVSANAIKNVSSKTTLVRFGYSGHNVLVSIGGVESINRLIGACRARDYRYLAEISRNVLRGHAETMQCRLTEATLRHPRLVSKMSFAKTDEQRNSDIVRSIEKARLLNENVSIRTFHETVVFFNVVTARCEHRDKVDLKHVKSRICLEIAYNTVLFFLETAGFRHALWLNDKNELAVDFDLPYEPRSLGFSLLRTTEGLQFHHRGKFLCADPDGTLVFDRDAASIWETFRVGA